MKIEHIAYFLAMKDSSSLSEASAKAYISQQGYGKVIAALESALGCKLVERDARGAHLTSAGLLFMRHAEAMVAEFEKAKMDLRTQRADLDILREYDGNMAFSDVCMNTFEPFFSSKGLLNRTNREELSLGDALARAEESDWVCLCDVCAQVYPDYAERWDMDTLAIGQVGVVAPRNLLGDFESQSAEEVIEIAPLAVFDCQATREIYELLFGVRNFGDIKMRTTRDVLLREGLRRGDFAVLSDSFHWTELQSKIETPENPLVFVPFRQGAYSLFGFVRKKDLPYGERQRAVVDAMLRSFANLSTINTFEAAR